MSQPTRSRFHNFMGMVAFWSLLVVPLVLCIWWSLHTAQPMTRDDKQQAVLGIGLLIALGLGVLIGRAK